MRSSLNIISTAFNWIIFVIRPVFPQIDTVIAKTTWGYTDVARSGFKTQTGVDPVDIDPKNPNYLSLWQEWNTYKVNQVNRFVERALAKTSEIQKPGLQICAAVFPNADSALAVKHQDWRTWAQNGWIDFFTPMTLTSADKVIQQDTANIVAATDHKIPIDSGIFGPFNDNSAEQILEQLNKAKEAGASGYVLFDTAHLNNRTLEALHVVQTSKPMEVTTPETPENTPVPTAEKKKKRRHWWWP